MVTVANPSPENPQGLKSLTDGHTRRDAPGLPQATRFQAGQRHSGVVLPSFIRHWQPDNHRGDGKFKDVS
jgi:hypothetical protein